MTDRSDSQQSTTAADAAGPDDSTTSVAQYLAPLRRQARVVFLVTLVTVALGFVIAVAGPKSYTATTSVVVQPVAADPTEALESTERTADMATETRIAASQAVARATSERFRELAVEVTPEDAETNISVRNNPQDSRVLDISYRSSDQTVARVGSELAAAAYLTYRAELNNAALDAARASVDAQIAVLQEQLVAAEEQVDQTTVGSSARLVAEVERTSVQGELAAQQRALAGLSTLAVDVATVIDEAQEPRSADGLGGLQVVVGALAGGLILGVIAAWIVDLLGLASTSFAVSVPRPRARSTKADEPADADDPFDDSDARDPLELLKQLDGIQADPKLAIEQSKARAKAEKEAKADEEEAATDQPEHEDDGLSFSERFPVEYFDADGGAGDLIDQLDDASSSDGGTDGHAAGDDSTGFDVDLGEFGSERPVSNGAGGDEQFGPPPALDGLPGFDTLPTLDTAGSAGEDDDSTPESLGPRGSNGSGSSNPFEQDAPSPFDQPFDGTSENEPFPEIDASGWPDTSITEGDPSSFEAGPSSWDDPFADAGSWDDLRTSEDADATESATPESAAAPSPLAEPAPTTPPLVASNDLMPLFGELARLGAHGPATVLAVSDGHATAGLTAGFQVADELRALGTRVLLIDTRIEEPALDALFPGGPGVGLAQVMSGEAVLDQAIRSLEGLDGLFLLTTGTVGPDTAGLLTGPAFERLLSQAQLDYHAIMVIGEVVVGEHPDQPIDLDRTRAVAAATDGLIVGTDQPVGSEASQELMQVLAGMPVETLHLIAAQTNSARGSAAATPEASGV